jgi:hypothetical protein
LSKKIYDIERRMMGVSKSLNGDPSLSRREFETLPGINGLVNGIAYSLWNTTSGPYGTLENMYKQATEKFGGVHTEIKAIDAELRAVEQQLEKSGAPYTPGRLPEWK